MKSMIVKVVAVIAALVAIVGTSYAAGGRGGDSKKVQVELVEHKNDVVALHFKKPENQVIKVKIYDTKTNKVVFIGSKKKHDLAIIKYDLSHLPTGNYKIEVTAGVAVFEKEIKL